MRPLDKRACRRCAGRPALALLACLLASPEGYAAEPRVLVLTDGSAAPYTTSERTGFLNVVATEAFRRAGIELRVVKIPSERALLLANSGLEDGALMRQAGIEQQYPDLIRVPETLGKMGYSAFSKNASIPASYAAFRGRAVGFIRGWKSFEQAMAGAEHVVAADDAEQLFRLLQLDRIEVALYERYMGLALIKKHAIEGVRMLEPLLATADVFIYLHRRHAEHVPKLAGALRAMKQDGFYQRAFREKLLPYTEGGPR